MWNAICNLTFSAPDLNIYYVNVFGFVTINIKILSAREELREKYFSNKALRSLDEVENRLCNGLVELSEDPGKLKSMTNFPYLRNITH